MANCLLIGSGGGGGSSWIEEIPTMHRNIFRGQSLGDTVTAAQLAAIDDGSFDGLYVGDYWTKSVTIDGVTKTVNWRVADINYYLNSGDTEQTKLTKNHLIVVPDSSLYDAYGPETVNYSASTFRTTTLEKARTAINAAFPGVVLSHRMLFDVYSVSDLGWVDSTVEIMQQVQVIGHEIDRYQMKIYSINFKQFALFRLSPEFIIDPNDTYWLCDYINTLNDAAAIIDPQGVISGDGYNVAARGVRPYFLLGAAE